MFTCNISVYKNALQFPRCVSCNDFAGTSMEAPLDGLQMTVGLRMYACVLLVLHKNTCPQKYTL
jgi:hypothetical protein